MVYEVSNWLFLMCNPIFGWAVKIVMFAVKAVASWL
jgi:hypothetical protein